MERLWNGFVNRLSQEFQNCIISGNNLHSSGHTRLNINILIRACAKVTSRSFDLGPEAAKLAKKELSLNEPLLKTGDIGEVDVIRLKRQLIDVETQIAAKKNKYFQDAQAELTKVEEDLAGARQAATQRKDSLDHTELRTPLAGVVKNVRLTTIGAVVKPGEEVLIWARKYGCSLGLISSLNVSGLR